MPLSEGRTTSPPKILLAIALVLFILRISSTIYDHVRPKEKDPIDWKTEKYLEQAIKAPNGKLILLWFTADWCAPCKTLQASVFHNSEVVKVINEKFIPVKIVDRKKEDGKNSDVVQILESKFRLYVFPTLIVALPTPELDTVDTELGGGSALSCLDFFAHAIKDAPFNDGISRLAAGDTERAIEIFKQWLPSTLRTNERSIYASLYLSAAYVIHGDNDEAKSVLEESETHSKDHSWPRPLINYLDQSSTEIIESAEEEHLQLLDAHYFAGILSLSKKDDKGAIAEFRWVRAHGAKGNHAYDLATGQLQKMHAPLQAEKQDGEHTDSEK